MSPLTVRRRQGFIERMVYVGHEARGHPPHHRDHRERPAQRRLLRRGDGAPAGQENRQPGQPDRLPPLLRRRGGGPGRRSDLLRVPRRGARPGRRRDGAPDRLAGRRAGRRSTSGRAGSAPTTSRRAARATASTSPTRRGSTTSCSSPTSPTRRWSPTTRRSRESSPCRASTRCAPTRRRPEASSGLLEALEFEPTEAGWEARGVERGGLYIFDSPPAERGVQGAGSVHHVAWASSIEEHMAWRDKAIAAGARPTPEIDRFYFKSIYFREPSGVLFEIATLGPRLHRRRAARAPRREALAAARFRAPARRGRTEPAPGRSTRAPPRPERRVTRRGDPCSRWRDHRRAPRGAARLHAQAQRQLAALRGHPAALRPLLPRLLPALADRPRPRPPRQRRPDRRRQPPQLPRPLHRRRLPALAAADELRRQGRALPEAAAGLVPLAARRLPDPPRRIRRGGDGRRRAWWSNAAGRSASSPRARGSAAAASPTRSAGSAGSPCRPARRSCRPR